MKWMFFLILALFAFLYIVEAPQIHLNKNWEVVNSTFTISLAGHSRPRLNEHVFYRIFYQWDLLSKEAAWEIDPNRWSLWCPAAAQLAGSQRAKTKNELNWRQKELIYPPEVFTALLVKHCWLWLHRHMEPRVKIEVDSAHECNAEPSASENWCICLRSWLPAQIDRGRCFLFL